MTGRRFELHRDIDVNRISGTGHIADGIQWDDGHVALRWRGDKACTSVWTGINTVRKVHGHGNYTRFVWLDEPLTIERPERGKARPAQCTTCRTVSEEPLSISRRKAWQRHHRATVHRPTDATGKGTDDVRYVIQMSPTQWVTAVAGLDLLYSTSQCKQSKPTVDDLAGALLNPQVADGQ